MSYVRDNGLARARRRRERRSLAILVLCGLLVIGAFVFAATFMSSSGKKDAACPNGTVSQPPAPQSQFQLNVYNADGPKGAAGDAAKALKTYNFNVASVANDPYKTTQNGVGVIRFGAAGATFARDYVAKRVLGAQLVEDGRDGTSVDVVLGKNFPTLTPAPSASSTKPVCK